MKNRYRKFRRGNVWWCHDSQTGKQTTLKTKSKNDAIRLLDSMNQPYQNAGFHLEMARTHLNQGDARRISRNWQNVFDDIIRAKTGSTKFRWERAAKDKAFVSILNRVVVETTPDDFLAVLKVGKISTNVFLRRLHNFAFGMNWLLAPIIPINAWPKVEFGEKRAITADEHRRIIEREKNPERKAFYELCWHVGGSQTDMATLTAESVDWQKRTFTYFRMKTGTRAQLEIGVGLEKLLRSLPAKGNLFPYLATVREADRATEFRQRCNGLGKQHGKFHAQENESAGHRAVEIRGVEPTERFAGRGSPAPLSGESAGGRPGHGVSVALPPVEHPRRDAAFVSVCVGGTRIEVWIPRTIRDGEFGAQQQSGAPRLCETGADEIAVAGRIRTEGGGKGGTPGVNTRESN